MQEINFQGSPKIIIPKKVKAQIDYLHNKFPGVEWSGMLFYSIKGDLDNPNEVVITIEYIYPCDVGTSASTKYDPDQHIADAGKITKYHFKGWKHGHIHTHHNMEAYFSGVDMSELYENTKHYENSYYLSLIVNNAEKYCAKLSMTLEGDYKYLGKPLYSEKHTAIGTYDCDIEIVGEKLDKNFLEKCEAIKPKPVIKAGKSYGKKSKQKEIFRWTDDDLLDVEIVNIEEDLQDKAIDFLNMWVTDDEFEIVGTSDLGKNLMELTNSSLNKISSNVNYYAKLALEEDQDASIDEILKLLNKAIDVLHTYKPKSKDKANIFKQLIETIENKIMYYGGQV